MWQDPIVEDIRKHSQQYAAQFHFELEAIFRDLREQQRQSGRNAVSLPPKRFRAPVPVASQRENTSTVSPHHKNNA